MAQEDSPLGGGFDVLLTVNSPARGATYFASKARGDVAAFVDLDFGEGPWSDLVRAVPRATCASTCLSLF